MPFHLLYIEDSETDIELLSDALDVINKDRPSWSKIKFSTVVHPSELPAALILQPDVVLADVFYDSEVNRLKEIIKHVRDWDKASPNGFSTPIIAYTKGGEETLKECFEQRNELYDIWHKLSANADYVAWRFQRLAADLPRYRPDATIQKRIAGLPAKDCPVWHKHVLTLVKNYGEGRTEHEQVEKCSGALIKILDILDKEHAATLMELWEALASAEPLLRAASPKVRGIARHSINVFWLGYWLINHRLLKDKMERLWCDMLDRRGDAMELKDINPLEGFNAVWLLASLFHDAGKFHEQGESVVSNTSGFFSKFDQIGLGRISWTKGTAEKLLKTIEQDLHRLSTKPDDRMVNGLREHISACSLKEKPDHGAVSAAYLSSIAGATSDNKRFSALSCEASRAVLIHSCLPAVYDLLRKNESPDHLRLEWQKDPVASLLLFCDQIQTWDRHNPIKENQNYPDRAELSYLEVVPGVDGGKPEVKGCIDYIAPSRVSLYPRLSEEIGNALEKIILVKPKTTMLYLLQKDHWPFTVYFDCALSGEKLDIKMDFS